MYFLDFKVAGKMWHLCCHALTDDATLVVSNHRFDITSYQFLLLTNDKSATTLAKFVKFLQRELRET